MVGWCVKGKHCELYNILMGYCYYYYYYYYYYYCYYYYYYY
jgi:hypothetical protein